MIQNVYKFDRYLIVTLDKLQKYKKNKNKSSGKRTRITEKFKLVAI